MDPLDEAILAQLQDGARRSYREIGEVVGLTAPAVKRRVDRLEEQRVIRSYTAVVDPKVGGWSTHAFVFLHVEGHLHGLRVAELVRPFPEIQAAYTLAGEASAILRIRARDTEHLERTLERLRDLPGVIRTETQMILSMLFERG
jgi:DNA-binding Lrp family transcriptional regulator